MFVQTSMCNKIVWVGAFLCILLVRKNSSKLQKNRTEVLNRLLNNHVYDRRVRPGVNGPATNVSINLLLSGFGEIDEIGMDYTVSLYLRQSWLDERLQHNFTDLENDPIISIPPQFIERIWLPDVFFPNEKQGRTHDITIPNKMLRIYSNGTVMYAMRLTLVLSCPMILTHFPLDRQICKLEMESFAYDFGDVIFLWSRNTKAIAQKDDMELPQFDLIKNETSSCTKRYATGTFTCLRATFELERQCGFYLLQTYIPSVLIVILSWVSFWIHMDAVPARISLGVTTVLTMTTQLSGSKQSLPKVSYPKAIDVWMATCMLFVFSSLLEYAFVNVLVRKSERLRDQKDDGMSADTSQTQPMKRSESDVDTKCQNCVKDGRNRVFKFWESHKPHKSPREVARAIDKTSRVCFPLCFVAFNVVYWSVYGSYRPFI
ncbi:glycine receptor subunit alpha-2-like isoform X2 [Tubulanus polymorphus]|uniref:glycine receptor subunit alpha-2-like isoform X2 n=1 Tax=Tubulanus polymorphus TaxID=672921 RepID=UPI003DA31CC5